MKNRGEFGKVNNTGMISVEATVMLTLMIIFFTVLLRFMDTCTMNAKVQEAVSLAAKEMSTFAGIKRGYFEEAYGDLSDVRLASYGVGEHGMLPDTGNDTTLLNGASYDDGADEAVIARIVVERGLKDSVHNADEYLKQHGVKGGLSGISYAGSTVEAGGRLVVRAEYEVEYLPLPFVPGYTFTKKVVAQAVTKVWED